MLKDIVKVAKKLNSDISKEINKNTNDISMMSSNISSLDDTNLMSANISFLENVEITKILIDSREDFDSSSLFIAIKGENFDGNKFAKDAYDKGCRHFVLNYHTELPKDAVVFICEDTILFQIKLARLYREKFNIPFISVTGSCGKTTTKELIHLFLSTKYDTLKTEGNLNNEIGVPKTIFRLKGNNEIAVIEAGMNHKGELMRISEAIGANVVLINNIEPVHIAFLGSIENIARAKSELFKNTKENAIAIINKDTNCVDIINEEAKKNGIKNIIEFSIEEASDIKEDSFVYKNILFKHSLLGRFNTLNIIAALKVAEVYGIVLEECSKVLPRYKSTKNRMQIININGTSIINDSYNSNPAALANMLKYLSQKKEKHKIAVIGDMLETETEETKYHKDIGNLINDLDIELVITSGKHSKDIFNTVKCAKYHFEKLDDVTRTLKKFLKKDTAVLIKASLGMRFINIIESIKK